MQDGTVRPSSPSSSDVFLSFNSQDRELVEKLAKHLDARGLDVWFDAWRLLPGDPWQEQLEAAIKETTAAIVCVGAKGLGPWEVPEMRALLTQAVRRGIRIIPLLLPGAVKPELPLFLEQFTWSDCRSGLSNGNVEQLVAGLRRTRAEYQRALASSRLQKAVGANGYAFRCRNAVTAMAPLLMLTVVVVLMWVVREQREMPKRAQRLLVDNVFRIPCGVQVRVGSAEAIVYVDGQKTSNKHGVVELIGWPGDVFRVRVELDGKSVSKDVVVDDGENASPRFVGFSAETKPMALLGGARRNENSMRREWREFVPRLPSSSEPSPSAIPASTVMSSCSQYYVEAGIEHVRPECVP